MGIDTQRTSSSSNTSIGLIGITILVAIIWFAGRQFPGTSMGQWLDKLIHPWITPDEAGLFWYYAFAYWTFAELALFGVVALGVFHLRPRDVFLLPGNSSWSLRKTMLIVVGVAAFEVAMILLSRSSALSYALHPGNMAGNLFSNLYEEILYRGFMLGLLIRFTGKPWYAIVVTSIFFTLGHSQYVGWMSVGLLVLAIPFAWITWKTKWILWAWILHMLVDWPVDLFLRSGQIDKILSGG